MKEEVFNGIKYQLDEEILTADVIENVGRERKVDIPEVVVFNEVSYRVTRIKVEGFSGYSSLTSITIPKSVTSIESGAFSGCDSQVSIVVAEGNTVYDSSDNCNAIIEKATNTLICGCRNTTIPNSVKSIGAEAFCRCEMLTDIGFRGTRAQWGRIELGNGWNDEVCTRVVNCTDGDVEI